MAFMKVNQRRVRYRGGFGSVGRRDFSLRAVSVPVVLSARWGVGFQKDQESMGRGAGSKKRNHVFILWMSVWLVSVVAR